jgi:CheY-like chemotaxis protein
LSIVKGILGLLGGKIRVESEKGMGSVFYFTIPIKTATGYAENMEGDSPHPAFSGKRVVLIAEDDESNILYLETLLKKFSITALVAKNGKDAVTQCNLHPEIDLVLMDLKMPVMDGYKATSEIKLFRKKLPVIAVTAYAMHSDEKKAREAGCDDYMAKPFQRDLLHKMLKKYGIVS